MFSVIYILISIHYEPYLFGPGTEIWAYARESGPGPRIIAALLDKRGP